MLHTALQSINHVPVLHVDGEPISPVMFYGSGDVFFDTVRRLSRRDIHLHSHNLELVWGPDEEAETAQRDQINSFMERLLEADPEALLLPRFGTEPAWWAERHPDQRMVWGDGSHGGISSASQLWRREMLPKLAAFVNWLEGTWGDHILGYFPHVTGESYFMYWWNRDGELPCFEPVFLGGWRAWLEDRYGSIPELNRAWNAALTDFADVRLPTAEERWASTAGLFRDPDQEQWLIDFTRYGNEVVYDAIHDVCHTIKEACEQRKITMVFYGYLMEMSGNWHGYGCGPIGHCALQKVLDDPDIDYVAAPKSYSDRAPGGAVGWMGPIDSVIAGGTGWGDEIDVRTHISSPDSGFGRCATPDETEWVHTQAFVQALVHNSFMWFMDMGGCGWLNDDRIADTLGRIRELALENARNPRPFASDVAVVVDEEAHLHMAYDAGWLLGRPLLCDLRSQLNRIGTTPAWRLLGEFLPHESHQPVPRLTIMLNTFCLNSDQLIALRRRFENSGATVVWFYAPGYILDGRVGTDGMTALTGFEFDVASEPSPIRVFTNSCTSSLLDGVARDTFPEDTDTQIMVGGPASRIPLQEKHVGTRRVAPRFSVRDSQPGNDVVARFKDGAIAIARRQENGFTSVFVGTFWIPARLLANIARESDCHLYAEPGNIVTTDGRWLAITDAWGGAHRINLPAAGDVIDAISNAFSAESTKEFGVHLAPGQTRLLRLSPENMT